MFQIKCVKTNVSWVYFGFFSRTTVSISTKQLYPFENMFYKLIFAATVVVVAAVVVLHRIGDGINVSINF